MEGLRRQSEPNEYSCSRSKGIETSLHNLAQLVLHCLRDAQGLALSGFHTTDLHLEEEFRDLEGVQDGRTRLRL